MALTVEQLNERLKMTYEWAKQQLPEQARANIVNVLKQRQGKPLPLDKMAGFTITGYCNKSTISNPPQQISKSTGKPFYPQDLGVSVSQDSFTNAAILFYSAVKAWEITSNKLADPNNLTQVFGNRLLVSAKPRQDKDGNPLEGYWINVSYTVTTNALGTNSFQNLKLGSTVEGKTINYQNADMILRPSDGNTNTNQQGQRQPAGYIETKPSLYFKTEKNAAGEIIARSIVARCAELTLVPAPQREESISVDDLLGMGLEPTVASSQPTAASQAPTAPAPLEEHQPTPDEILGMIQI